jgi:hypothetical protein
MSHNAACTADAPVQPPVAPPVRPPPPSCTDIVIGNKRWDLSPVTKLGPIKYDSAYYDIWFSICKGGSSCATGEVGSTTCVRDGSSAACMRPHFEGPRLTCLGQYATLKYSAFKDGNVSSYFVFVILREKLKKKHSL